MEADFNDVLSDLNRLLRCPICDELLDTAVHFPECSHTYCSKCIRLALHYKSECPSCRIETSSTKLVPVRLIDEIVSSFSRAADRVEGQGVEHHPQAKRHKAGPSGEEVSVVSPVVAGTPEVKLETRTDRASMRLPKKAYNLLKIGQLRELCKQQGLSAVGTEAQLQWRHMQWVIAFNANLDRAVPRPVDELREELKALEKALHQQQSGQKIFGKKQSSGVDWEALIAQAKESKAQHPATPSPMKPLISSQDVLPATPIQVQDEAPQKKPMTWQVVWSEALQKPFYFDPDTLIGTFSPPPPEELE